MLNKGYIPFFVSIGFFVIILIYSLVIYTTWDGKEEEDLSAVEVNLPVLDLQKYYSLSKQQGDGNVDDDS